MHKEAGRPWPVVCPDDEVIDYMVMEAVAMRVRQRDEEDRKKAEKEAKIRKFKEDKSSLDHLR